MYIIRNKHNGLVEFWNKKGDTEELALEIIPSIFKALFPNQKLPRKGTCKYVELRLYIPGKE